MSRSNPATICLVDDDPISLRYVQEILAKSDYSPVSFHSSEEFLAQRNETTASPRCLILDWHLPGMNGYELQQVLADEAMMWPIIMISAQADIRTAVTALREGALDFLEKPIKPQVLLRAVERALVWDLKQADRARHIAEFHTCRRRLTTREKEVLDLTVAGRNSKQIAATLEIGVQTVLKHRANMLTKMRVKNEVELTLLVSSIEGPPDHASITMTG